MRRLALALVLAASGAASAQDATTPGAPGAEAAVRAYVEAFASGDWTTAVRQMDQAEVAEFADLLGLLADADDADDFDIDTKGEPAKAVAAFFGQLSSIEPAFGEAMQTIGAAIIGTVLEGDSLAHVVARSSFDMLGAEMGGVEVTTARWKDGRWGVTFGEELTSMRSAIRVGLEMREEEFEPDDE